MKSDDDLLADELGKLGKYGGTIGTALSGNPASGRLAEMGGSLGASFTAKFLPTESFTQKVKLQVPADEGIRIGFSILQKLGELNRDEPLDSPHPILKAVVGSGFFNMNPAIVYYEILESGSSCCVVTITAAAKEGLIKQNTARKAVEKVTRLLKRI